jgi:hypothetical protein
MEWGIGRFDAFVPAFPPPSESATPFPRSSTPEARYVLPLGVDDDGYFLRGQRLPLDGSAPLSASATYLVMRTKQLEVATTAEEPFSSICLETYAPWLTFPNEPLSAEDQVRWIEALLPSLQADLRCDPSRFRTAQAGWRHHAIRRMQREWRTVDPAQNGFWFSMAQSPMTEAFALVQNRPDQAIVVCDLRSAYGGAIANSVYPHPSSWVDVTELPLDGRPALVLCRLSCPTPWLSRHHPWRYSEQGVSCPFYWNVNDTVAGWFTRNELEAVAGLCTQEILSVKVPTKWGSHPLSNQVKTWFASRMSSSAEVAAGWKVKIASAHSWTIHSALETIACETMPDEMAERMVSRPMKYDRKVCYTARDPEIGPVTWIHQAGKSGVWLPAVWTLLEVRTRLFRFLRWAHDNHPAVALCYTNVDSAHWSMPAAYKDTFIKSLNASEWVGSNIGDARIEHVFQRGLWLRPAAYILWNEDGSTVSTLGQNPWAAAKQHDFWQRDWQAMHTLAGSNRAAWYQRPKQAQSWTSVEQHVTRTLQATIRWKEAAWLKARDHALGDAPPVGNESVDTRKIQGVSFISQETSSMPTMPNIKVFPNGATATASEDGLYRFIIELPEGLWEAYDLDEQKAYASEVVTGDEAFLSNVDVEVLEVLQNGCVKLCVTGSIR